jgi:hypothetical protein
VLRIIRRNTSKARKLAAHWKRQERGYAAHCSKELLSAVQSRRLELERVFGIPPQKRKR